MFNYQYIYIQSCSTITIIHSIIVNNHNIYSIMFNYQYMYIQSCSTIYIYSNHVQQSTYIQSCSTIDIFSIMFNNEHKFNHIQRIKCSIIFNIHHTINHGQHLPCSTVDIYSIMFNNWHIFNHDQKPTWIYDSIYLVGSAYTSNPWNLAYWFL